MSALILILTANFASADDLLLHGAADPSLLTGRVALIGEKDFDSIQAVPIERHFAQAQPHLDQGRVEVCEELSEVEILDTLLDRADGAMAYLELDKAARLLNKADRSLRCLDEPIDPVTATRMYLLTATVALKRSDKHGAGEAFAWAHRYQPGLQWRDDLPEEGRELFEASAMAMYMNPPAELRVVPDLPEGLLIDGREPDAIGGEVELPAGVHIVQLTEGQIRTFELTLQSGPATLSLPQKPDEPLDLLETPEERAELANHLALTLPQGQHVWLATADQIWEHEIGGEQWTEHWEPVFERSEQLRARHRTGWAVGGTGAGVAAMGAGLAVVFLGNAMDAHSDGSTAFDEAEFLEAQGRFNDGSSALTGSKAAIGLGVIAGAVGFALTRIGRDEVHKELMANQKEGGE